jgi:hypothetical protein
LRAARNKRKAAAMKQPSGKQANDAAPPRSNARLTQGMLLGAVVVLIIVAAVKFS